MFLIAMTVIAMATGQILFKLAALNLPGGGSWAVQLAFNGYLWTAMVVYASATALWVALLRQVPLHLAYPFVALSFVFVPVLGHFVLHESLRWQSLAGALVIVIGVWISVGWE